MDVIKAMWPHADISHISYDPTLRRDRSKKVYSIKRGSTHDGTLGFTHELFDQILAPVLLKRSCHANDSARLLGSTDVKYVIGDIRHAVVYGMVRLPCSETTKYPGLRERMRMPVYAEPVENKNGTN